MVHVPSFFIELGDLKQKGLDTTGRIFISDRAHVVFDLHQLIDRLEEEELRDGAKDLKMVNGKKERSGEIGTTRKGIGKCLFGDMEWGVG